MKHSLEVFRRVYDDEDGVSLQIGPSPDNPNWIELRAVDVESRKYYGDIRLAMPPQMARLIGEALIATTNEILEKK